MKRIITVALFVLSLTAYAAPVATVAYPGKAPGVAIGEVTNAQITLHNDALAATWRIDNGQLMLDTAVDLDAGFSITGGALFSMTLADGTTLTSSDFRVTGNPERVACVANSSAHRLAEQFAGQTVTVPLATADGRLQASWSATLRDASNYVTIRITLTPTNGDLPIATLCLVDVHAKGARVEGSTQGAPVVADKMFVAYEHPISDSRVEGDHVTCTLQRNHTLRKGVSLTQSSVIGVTPPGQLRRGFLYYVERERAHPYRPFLHYNSWYDIAWGNRKFDEAESLAAISAFGKELVEKRGVVIDSFVFDDGWDDNKTLWQFHDGFPNGFEPLQALASQYNSAVGTWLSPFGGYGKAKDQRIAYGQKLGFETNRMGFAMAGPKYYACYRDICVEMMRNYGVNYFKYDGMGAALSNMDDGATEFLGDIEALMRLMAELRGIQPDVYISATTGTWCSPYFLWHADNIWRNGHDMGFTGRGSKRQQWINYRDNETYKNIVHNGPLYPLNALMTQGIAHANYGTAAAMDDDPKEMAAEIRSFFASGTSLQELYITPQKLNDTHWDLLAEGAQWARANADVLVDTHWIGESPRSRVYGWASWSPRKGILALRNPSDKPKEMAIDIGEAFELPKGAATHYRLSAAFDRDSAVPDMVLEQGTPHTFSLAPFEVLVFDAMPVR